MTKEEIKELVNLFAETNISKIKIKEQDGFEIELERDMCCDVPQPVQTQVQAPQPINVNVVNEVPNNQSKSNKPSIKSPMVGTFYQAPSPGAAPFVKAGTSVKKGDTVAIIEAMKIMNEIEAEFDCRIVDILVSDGQPVEFGMPLFAVEKL
ncbi:MULTISPECIES: acetyl-CoA carboxylase biotin carboxyl carrier protein [unclassified Campylobacter]|uniref:acetyl-CoA carboxylase biotin carboxyl carrier protein n=1 Tax=unclassified Campylobacter TaxID=2593542 RepID=UPI0012382416|nr:MULTISPECIES: acetyl-CoA carboxylase biotin carboxyl carrier protein [unclassified Campylobacter]KAA6225545.1 acetyl-CoA carboxylase biotin carboxyl carrier protein [Campylobacter sp. LR196d]KAA6226982.1 acetyl-CoA carboxylase biotin carboxyl carrier protein [Campylobacter sp. LR185c]KAA6229816.1 acetyl-CoA carboxylase biotin carboxyl carrier protein [Campylobacter sp. LR286c]KAA6234339.1 acetyl-CoA carboxylase biotin carboxyl carrier protein [Campylobacter sp. LR291e]KAA6234559.1 acetyl-Co